MPDFSFCFVLIIQSPPVLASSCISIRLFQCQCARGGNRTIRTIRAGWIIAGWLKPSVTGKTAVCIIAVILIDQITAAKWTLEISVHSVSFHFPYLISDVQSAFIHRASPYILKIIPPAHSASPDRDPPDPAWSSPFPLHRGYIPPAPL